MTTVSTHEFRKRLSELLELAYYKNEPVHISRSGKPMARLVGEPTMQALEEIIDYIIENDPALADTLAIMVDDDIRDAIMQGRKEWEAGERIPIEEALK